MMTRSVLHQSSLAFALVVALSFLAPSQEASALVQPLVRGLPDVAKISSNSRALPDDEIVRFAKLAAEAKGTKRLGYELGGMELPRDVLEDAFLRIATHQEKLSRAEAEQLFRNLGGVPGFSTTLRKVIGNSEAGTAGHLFELRVASEAVDGGLAVREIGRKFSDGLKRGPTDIDLILERGGKIVAIEAKYYGVQTRMPLDKYRADLDTLVSFKASERENVMMVFSIANKPVHEAYLRRLKHESARREVELLFGDPRSTIIQINQLLKMR